MHNVTMKVSGTTLTIEVDLSKPGELSKSQKTMVLASTHGNEPVPDPKFRDIKVGLNVFRPKAA